MKNDEIKKKKTYKSKWSCQNPQTKSSKRDNPVEGKMKKKKKRSLILKRIKF
jgi:hypothetical protein